MQNNLLLITIQDNKGKSSIHTVVPDALVTTIIKKYHDSLLHAGWERTLQKSGNNFGSKTCPKEFEHSVTIV